jgi:hypothetical protein
MASQKEREEQNPILPLLRLQTSRFYVQDAVAKRSGKTAVTIHLSRKKSKYNVIFAQNVGVAFQEESQTFPNHFLFLQGGLFLKDSSLSVVYRRGDNGQLFVWLYRGQLHIGTVEVNSFNCMKVIRGVANASPVLVKYLPAEALLEETL